MYGNRFLVITDLLVCHIEHILVTEFHIGRCSLQDTADVNAKYLKAPVHFHAVHDSMLGNGTLGKAVGSLNKVLDGFDTLSYLIHSGTEYGTLEFYHIAVTVQCRVNTDRVLIHKSE